MEENDMIVNRRYLKHWC